MKSHMGLTVRENFLIANKEAQTFEETCDYAGISRNYLYKLTAAGNIPHSKPNERKSIGEIEAMAESIR
ncbi:hypothetical protein [Flagellimonas hymeniacidonis]|uniref:hypothetical protein n=1 Tax=Flagellimonas hymeniacidonis TaxID=2603628 RepID=UPI0029390670|nr:hypothetical protein [Flagellimonas hymeniacidonis]